MNAADLPMVASRYRPVVVVVRAGIVLAIGTVLVAKVNWTPLSQHFDRRLLFGWLALQPFMIGSFVLVAVRLSLLAGLPVASHWTGMLKAHVLSVGLSAVFPGRAADLVKATYLRQH